jgi:hypothetical protein
MNAHGGFSAGTALNAFAEGDAGAMKIDVGNVDECFNLGSVPLEGDMRVVEGRRDTARERDDADLV